MVSGVLSEFPESAELSVFVSLVLLVSLVSSVVWDCCSTLGGADEEGEVTEFTGDGVLVGMEEATGATDTVEDLEPGVGVGESAVA